MEKLEWCGYGETFSKIRFGATHERDGQTDGQTPGDGNSRAMHSIARQKSAKNSAHRQNDRQSAPIAPPPWRR